LSALCQRAVTLPPHAPRSATTREGAARCLHLSSRHWQRRAPPTRGTATTEQAHRLSLPRDLTNEITAELINARIRVARSASRVTALESLLDIVWQLEHELHRPVTLLDLLSTDDPDERKRRLQLARCLRG
jgi:hypothetical protein